MGNFNWNNSAEKRQSNGNKSFGGGNSDREMFKATCADCGKECEIPFRPTTGRPVYCRDDFKKHSPDEGRGRDTSRGNFRTQSRDGGRRGMQDRPMFDAVCDNCGDKCRVPFEPREGKATLCSNCFEEKGGEVRRSNNSSSPQLNDISAKLDRILELLTPTQKAPKTEKKAEVVVEDAVGKSEKVITEEKPKRAKKRDSKVITVHPTIS